MLDSSIMIHYEWSVRQSDHLEIVDSDKVDVIPLQGVRSYEDIRTLRRLVTATLGRLGCAREDDYVSRVAWYVRIGKE